MRKWFLLGIVIAAFLLRIIGLSSHPVGFTPDEASFGYDAYSLLKTGKDQWGEPWPLSFRSFGDFKLPLYTYLTIPTVAIFGLNEFAVRLPNAIFGTLAVVATYYLVLETLKRRDIALLASLFLAFSPWHIPLSRGAFEANLTTFFLPLGLYFFFKGLKNPKLLALSSIFLGLNLFSYHSARLLTVPVILLLIFQHKKELKSKTNLIPGIIIGVFVVLTAITMLMGSGSRAATSGIFNPTGGWDAVARDRYQAVLTGEPDILARIFNNKIFYFGKEFISSYAKYLSPQFLLTQGPAEGTYGMLPGMGMLAIYEFIGLIAFILLSNKKESKSYLWIIFWVLISPVAASLAKGPGYAANRAAFMMPAIQILAASGTIFFYEKIKNKFFIYLTGLVFALCFIFFIQGYIVGQKATQAKAMIYGAEELVKNVNSIGSKYDQIIVSKKLSEPHIYFLFYGEVNPKFTQEASKEWLNYEKEGLDWVDQLGTYHLGNFTFTSVQSSDLIRKNALLVGEPSDFNEKIKPDTIIYYPNQSPAYYLVKTQ